MQLIANCLFLSQVICTDERRVCLVLITIFYQSLSLCVSLTACFLPSFLSFISTTPHTPTHTHTHTQTHTHPQKRILENTHLFGGKHHAERGSRMGVRGCPLCPSTVLMLCSWPGTW